MLTTLLRSVRELTGYSVRTIDSEIGSVNDFCLDEKDWVIRAVAVDTVQELGAGRIFLPSTILEEADPEKRAFFVQLTAGNSTRALIDLYALERDAAWRFASEITGFNVYARDGMVGKIEGLILNDADLAVRYLAVNAEAARKKFLISPWWVKRMIWDTGDIFLGPKIQKIHQSPEYDFKTPVIREFESGLHAYYEKQPYWA